MSNGDGTGETAIKMYQFVYCESNHVLFKKQTAAANIFDLQTKLCENVKNFNMA